MGEFIDKTKSAGNKLFGKAKVELGQATDSPEMIAKGAAQQVKGKAQEISGAVKGAADDKI